MFYSFREQKAGLRLSIFVKINYQKTPPGNFQSRNGNGENTDEITEFYLRFCESYPFGVRKEAFEEAKGDLLKGKR